MKIIRSSATSELPWTIGRLRKSGCMQEREEGLGLVFSTQTQTRLTRLTLRSNSTATNTETDYDN